MRAEDSPDARILMRLSAKRSAHRHTLWWANDHIESVGQIVIHTRPATALALTPLRLMGLSAFPSLRSTAIQYHLDLFVSGEIPLEIIRKVGLVSCHDDEVVGHGGLSAVSPAGNPGEAPGTLRFLEELPFGSARGSERRAPGTACDEGSLSIREGSRSSQASPDPGLKNGTNVGGLGDRSRE